jgi:hypothetical protein
MIAIAPSLLGLLLAQQYFPDGVLGRNPQEHQSTVDRYTKYLKALHEPSLWELSQQDPNAEVYRFLWLRSFHNPIAVRLVVRASGSGWIHSRRTRLKRDYEPGGITHYSNSWLRKARTQSFVSAFEHANLWNLPTLREPIANVVQVDGAQWVIESVRNGKYHVVDRWSPEAGDPIREMGLLALKLSRLRVRAAEIY